VATRKWKGGAAAVAGVQSYLFGGTWEATDYVTLVVGDKTLTVVAGSTTISTIVDTIVTAWNALSATYYPEFSRITASRSSNSLILTADDPGVPFTCTITPFETGGGAADDQEIEGAGTATTGTADTTSAGPNDFSTAANWSGGAVPTTGDDVIFENSSIDCLYGLAQSGSTLTSLTIYQNYTGKIGLPERNASGYAEYRTTYLTISATNIRIGEGPGSGSGRIKINVGSVACTLNVFNTGATAEVGLAAVLWKGTSASNAVNVNKGTVDVAILAGETADVSGGLKVGFVSNKQGDSTVRCGTGVTFNAVVQNGGALETHSNISSVTCTDGEHNILAGAISALVIRGGIVRYNSTGTLGGNPSVSGSGLLDFSQDQRAKTVTNPIEVYGPDARVNDPYKVVATLVLDLNETAELGNHDIGRNIRVTRGTPA